MFEVVVDCVWIFFFVLRFWLLCLRCLAASGCFWIAFRIASCLALLDACGFDRFCLLLWLVVLVVFSVAFGLFKLFLLPHVLNGV